MPQARPIDLKKLALLGASLALAVWVSGSPWFLPVRLVVTAFHETGHAAAALLVGGSVHRLTVRPDSSGECLSAVPEGFFAKVLVYSGGYLGSAIAAGLLLVLTFRFGLRRPVLVAASVWLGLVGVFWAGDLFTLTFCIGTAAALGVMAKYLPGGAIEWLNLFLGGFCSLQALEDVRAVLWDGAARQKSDAQLLADLTWVPAIVWALGWSLACLAVLLVSARWALVAARKRLLEAPPSNALS